MFVTIIIPTRNRAHAITPCFDAIVAALSKAAHNEAEILVVDNGSTDDTVKVIQDWATSQPVTLRLLSEPNRGAAKARNYGMREAKGDLLVFIDDDCRMHPNYIADLLRYGAHDTGLVLRGGSVELGDSADLYLTTMTRPKVKRWSRKLNSARYENLGDTLLGCNLTMSKSVANLLGPYDARLGTGSSIPGGEDIDYVFRAYLADVTLEFVPDMAVYHFHGRRQAAEGAKLFQNYSIGGGALFAKYIFKAPSLCRPYYWDIKNLVKEIFSGSSNTFMPNINFSYKSKWWWYCVGMKRYALMRLRMCFARNSAT